MVKFMPIEMRNVDRKSIWSNSIICHY